jgi:hypothetical protein
MTLDRMKMSRLHEEFLAELVGGTRSKGSGNQWTQPADGRASRILNEYGWATEGKATCGQGIEITRKILEKLDEQAEGERPLIGLRWYADETLETVAHELVAMQAADLQEVLDDNARLREELQTALAANEDLASGKPLTPGSAAELVRKAQEHAAYLRRENQRLTGMVAMLGLLTPAQRELAELGMPPRELWPCYVVDIRPYDEPEKIGRRKRFWMVYEDGRVEALGEPRSVRVDRGIGTMGRLFINEQIIRRGELRINGVLDLQVRDDMNYQAPPPPKTDGIADTTGD